MATFKTIPIANIQAALYTLTIFSPGTNGTPGVPIVSFTFPLSPQHVRRETASMTTFYDMPSTSAAAGVLRQVDDYGRAPPIFNIRGTTGWKSHSMDAYLSSGLSAMTRVDDLITKFHTLNQQVLSAGTNNWYTMEYYDFFSGQYWQVVPFGNQAFDQDVRQPLMQYYDFRLAAIKKVAAPLSDLLVDAIASTLGVGAVSAMLRAQSALSSISSIMGTTGTDLSASVTANLAGINSVVSTSGISNAIGSVL